MASSPVDTSLMDNGTPHQCGICYKVFVSTKGLQQHSIIHTDRKPFNCEICGKPFRFKSNLFEHRSIHTGEQPYVCPFCGKTCRLKGNLKKHLKTHVKEPDELDRAYEAVTGGHNSSNDEAEGYDDQDVENTPSRRRNRKAQGGGGCAAGLFMRRHFKDKDSPLMSRQIADDEGYPMALSHYPPLSEMLSSDYAMIDFARAAQNIPFERYECRLCEVMFESRGEMRLHAETVHDKNVSPSETGLVWCDTCLRPFDDASAAEQHAAYHMRIRNYVESGDLILIDSETKAVNF